MSLPQSQSIYQSFSHSVCLHYVHTIPHMYQAKSHRQMYTELRGHDVCMHAPTEAEKTNKEQEREGREEGERV